MAKTKKKTKPFETFADLWKMYLIGILFCILACRNVFDVMLEWIFHLIDDEKPKKGKK
jgi:hypothetical protein